MALPIIQLHADDVAHVSKYDPSVRSRGLIERAIVRKTIETLIGAGFILRFDYGDDLCDRVETVEDAMKDAMACDEEMLRAYRRGPFAGGLAQYVGNVSFVYGNDGWDCISDHSLSLEEVLKPANEFAESLADGAVFLPVDVIASLPKPRVPRGWDKIEGGPELEGIDLAELTAAAKRVGGAL